MKKKKRKLALGCMSFLVLIVGILLYLGWATKPPKQYEVVDLGPLKGLEDKEGELGFQGYRGLRFSNVRINDKGEVAGTFAYDQRSYHPTSGIFLWDSTNGMHRGRGSEIHGRLTVTRLTNNGLIFGVTREQSHTDRPYPFAWNESEGMIKDFFPEGSGVPVGADDQGNVAITLNPDADSESSRKRKRARTSLIVSSTGQTNLNEEFPALSNLSIMNPLGVWVGISANWVRFTANRSFVSNEIIFENTPTEIHKRSLLPITINRNNEVLINGNWIYYGDGHWSEVQAPEFAPGCRVVSMNSNREMIGRCSVSRELVNGSGLKKWVRRNLYPLICRLNSGWANRIMLSILDAPRSNGVVGLIWLDGTPYLPDYLTVNPKWGTHVMRLEHINEQGQIVGNGFKDRKQRAFLLNPVEE